MSNEERSESAEREDLHHRLTNIAHATRSFIIQGTAPQNLLMSLAADPIFHPTDLQWSLLRDAADLNVRLVEVDTIQTDYGYRTLRELEVGNLNFQNNFWVKGQS